MSVMDDIRGAVVSGDKAGAKSMMEQVLADGANPTELLNSALISAMTEVGERFEHKDLFLPEMLIAARAMKGALAVLEPHLRVADVQPVGRILLATVSGDMHDIGKNVVGIMMEGAGFEVIDLGVDVAPERIVAMVKEYKPDLVDYKHFRDMLIRYQSQIRACSVMPQEDVAAYEYQPEEPVTKAKYEEIMHVIRAVLEEDIGKEHVDCDGGACPIDFRSNADIAAA